MMTRGGKKELIPTCLSMVSSVAVPVAKTELEHIEPIHRSDNIKAEFTAAEFES
jgi:hypothetical protein